jgi:hypothetical protein
MEVLADEADVEPDAHRQIGGEGALSHSTRLENSYTTFFLDRAVTVEDRSGPLLPIF